MNQFGIFGIGVLIGGLADWLLQALFIAFGGRRLKYNYAYKIFLDVNLFVPIIGGLIALLLRGAHLTLEIFFVSAIVGTILEYSLGRIMRRLHGKPIWEYRYLPIGKYTSWVSIAYWGAAGLLFVHIAQILQ